MDVSGVGQSPAGFSAVPETVLDPQRSSQTGPEKLGQVRQAPLDLLSDARLGRELLSLGLRPDPAKILAARALFLQQGSLDLTMLLDVDRSLQGMSSPGSAEADAAAFLVARQLPATTETVSWVLGRQNATEPSGMRMPNIIQRFEAAMAARSETPALPSKGDAPALNLPRPETGAPPQESTPSGTSSAPAAAPAKALTASMMPAPTPASPTPSQSPTPPVTPVPTPVPAAAAALQEDVAPQTPETPSPDGQTPVATKVPESAAAPAKAPTASTPATPAPANAAAPQPAAAAQALAKAVVSESASAAIATDASQLPDLKAATVSPEATAPQAPKSAEAPLRDLFAKLQALALPEGKPKEVEAALRKLIQALRPQEADLAHGEVAEAKERLTSLAAKAIARSPHDATVREVHDEIRFQQVNSVRHEGQTPHEFIIPVWWKGGSGEIRVQERPKGAARRSEEASAPVRVVMALDTPHLGAIRIDLLLAQRQVNCLVAVQDQGAADFLSERLTELRSAIEETGIRVNALGMKPFTADAEAFGPGDAKGVDFYG
ncbi:MAG TPA: flagellar hook-length control protein FliK [Stenomitos sp.]